MRISYKQRLLLYFTGLFAFFALVLVAFQWQREKHFRQELLETRLRPYADLVAGHVEEVGIANCNTAGGALFRAMPRELRLTIITRQGNVIFESSKAKAAKMENHLNRPEVHMALFRAEGSDIRLSQTTKREFYYFAKSYGSFIVRVALPYDATVRSFMKADNVFLWFVILVFPTTLVVLLYFADHFGKSIESLRLFIDSAERGLVDYHHIAFPQNELGEIGKAIMQKYQQVEASRHTAERERERLIRHFHYFKEGIAIFSADHHVVYANPLFLQYANLVVSRPTADLSTIWDCELFRPALEFINLNNKPNQQAEEAPLFRYTLQAGSTHIAVQLLVYADGTFEMTLADITQNEKARLLKQQMSQNITHELRTPVASIHGYLETLLSCPSLPEERRTNFLKRAYLQAERLTDLIRDVGLISKTEEAPDLMPRELVCITTLVQELIGEFSRQAAEVGISLSARIPPQTCIMGNYSLIYAIFRNLMENAIRYAPQAGKAPKEPLCAMAECYNEDKEFCYFRFYDNGKGVADEHLPRLFERFYRAEEGRTRQTGGTGLGLSIVRNAVAFHGGTISVRNRAMGGLEFLFTLKK